MASSAISAAGVPAKSFQSADFWDDFFTSRQGVPFEWYVDWPDLWPLLQLHCGLQAGAAPAILVPGCGNSNLSAAMYDEGFCNITNIDICRKVIEEMLRAHLRQRPKMFWKVMDMTKMQFADGSFDLVVDKGGVDALMGSPDEDPAYGKCFLSEVKRVLKPNGRYVCVTLAQKHIMEMLVSTFRGGWQTEIRQIRTEEVSKGLLPFLFIATRTATQELPQITLHAARASAQVYSVERVIQGENLLRARGALEASSSYDLEGLLPGRRIELTLGAEGKSKATYKAIILDAKDSCKLKLSCGVFLVPKSKAHEWLYTSEEGQWQVVESAEVGRLVMVFLETDILSSNKQDIQNDLAPLVRGLKPAGVDTSSFLMADDGALKGRLLEEIHSPLTGTMLVEDVISDKDGNSFRRLFFKRNPNLIQSEALLSVVKKEQHRHGAGRKKNRNSVHESKIDHSHLASSYHAGMVAGLALIAQTFESWISSKAVVRAMVVGLGAGMFPMFLYKHLPFSNIVAVELDGVVADLAKRHFGFVEDDRMQLHVGDGVAAVEAVATKDEKLHVLIIDADSADPSNGLSCPPAEFLQESFLRSAKAAIVNEGMLIINLVSRANNVYVESVSRLLEIFEEVYVFQLHEDLNRVLFALPQASPCKDSVDASSTLKRIATQFAPWGKGPKDLKLLFNKLHQIKSKS